MSLPAQPSVDPADQDTLLGMLRASFTKFLQNTDDMLPARVVAFDRGPPSMVQVQPLIRVVTTAGEAVSRAQLASIPVLSLGGGGMLLSFNLKPGDLGWIKANDRDISLFLQNGLETVPNTRRMHSFSDAVFIPDAMRGWSLNSEDAANAVLQTADGTHRIALWDDRIKLTAGGVSMTVKDDGVYVVGMLYLNGGIAQIGSGGSVSFSGGSVTHNGTNIGDTHIHSQGVDSHGDTEADTGGPHS